MCFQDKNVEWLSFLHTLWLFSLVMTATGSFADSSYVS